MTAARDIFRRPLRSLRVSVTDRCNIRCAYCMPEQDYVWLPRRDLLTFEEIERLVSVFESLGVTRVRLTGGEPLLRRDLPGLVSRLASRPRLADLAITTNGVLLADAAQPLADAGLHRVTVSLDTLDAERFRRLTRFDELARVLAGVRAAARVFGGLKIDAVVIRGINDDELVPLLEFGRHWNAEVRFIEYMDVGGASRWSLDQVVSRAEILERVADAAGRPDPLPENDSAPADRYRLPDGTVFGVISSTTQPFCRTCDRARLTADGMWLTCLYATEGLDLRGPLRSGATDQQLEALLRQRWSARADRGAEDRLALLDRTAQRAAEGERLAAHQEMHTRGG